MQAAIWASGGDWSIALQKPGSHRIPYFKPLQGASLRLPVHSVLDSSALLRRGFSPAKTFFRNLLYRRAQTAYSDALHRKRSDYKKADFPFSREDPSSFMSRRESRGTTYSRLQGFHCSRRMGRRGAVSLPLPFFS